MPRTVEMTRKGDFVQARPGNPVLTSPNRLIPPRLPQPSSTLGGSASPEAHPAGC
ncbi:hypothetical protein ACP70R_029660 [Stipagrostis hirtigluma subsp. patula]